MKEEVPCCVGDILYSAYRAKRKALHRGNQAIILLSLRKHVESAPQMPLVDSEKRPSFSNSACWYPEKSCSQERKKALVLFSWLDMGAGVPVNEAENP